MSLKRLHWQLKETLRLISRKLLSCHFAILHSAKQKKEMKEATIKAWKNISNDESVTGVIYSFREGN